MPKIHSESYGEGLPVILIHGFCETSAIWKPLINKIGLSHRVVTIDLPGFGKSPLPHHPFSIMDIAEMVHDHLEEKNLLDSLVIGHSLGGYVALALMERYYENYLGMGLFHSTALADDEEKKHARNKTINFVNQRGVSVFAESFVHQLFYSKNRSQLEQEIKEVTRIASQTNKDSLIQYMEAMRDRLDRSIVLGYNLPILFIAGEHDSSVPLEKSRSQYELITNPSITELKNVGHMGMYEDTAASYSAISKFLMQFSEADSVTGKGILPDRDLKRNLGCG